ncbi:hypothetical protein WJX75_001149 [Coccomyxa subellipsoidea]|uniref:P-loop containing nucleoside triphosphate hydrolase protein n=1 Tax=Coccomyxa subellipsoidea TaxID=248742 RepID=A0ABR2YWW7_9CHLO
MENSGSAKRKLPRSFLTQPASEPQRKKMSNGYGTGEIHRGRGGRGAFRIVHAGREPARTAPKDAPSAEGSKQAWASGDAQGSTMALEASRGRKLPSTFTASTGRTEGGTRQVIGASRATPSVHSEADTKAALRAALQGLELCGKDERMPPVGSMMLPLMRHQRLALDWMLRREAGSAAPTGGILADDQGLDSAGSSNGEGEVETNDSLAAKDPWEKGGLRGGTLVVVPTSVLHQWHQELRDKVATSAGLRTHVYHGKSKAWTGQELAKFGVVLTTYATMGLEAPPRLHAKKGGTDNKSRTPGPLFKVDWHRVILDEAQSIKNAHTLASHACRCLQTSRRWCLTGTPIQNTIDDLYSYFRFLKYEPYSRHAAFKSMLTEPLQSNPSHGGKLLRAALQGVLLRRTKGSTLDGKPIVQLPARQVELVRLHFSVAERAAYDELQRSSMTQLKALRGAKSSYMNMLLLLLRLRQACNHPWLASGARQSSPTGPLRDEEVLAIRELDESRSLSSHLVATASADSALHPRWEFGLEKGRAAMIAPHALPLSELTRSLHSTTSSSSGGIPDGDECMPAKVIVFSQWTRMLDLIQVALQASNIRFSRLDGTMGVSARGHAVAAFTAEKGTDVLLVSLKAASLGLNLNAANYVVLMDLWWNPAVEEQAIDRAHRIGQTRTVRVMRLTIADTVEDRILALQEKKRRLADAALGNGEGGVQASRLTMEDLHYLFSTS